eukprot:470110-Prorocentrum_lima.AAC.1
MGFSDDHLQDGDGVPAWQHGGPLQDATVYPLVHERGQEHEQEESEDDKAIDVEVAVDAVDGGD